MNRLIITLGVVCCGLSIVVIDHDITLAWFGTALLACGTAIIIRYSSLRKDNATK